jgi:hypothetical protein
MSKPVAEDEQEETGLDTLQVDPRGFEEAFGFVPDHSGQKIGAVRKSLKTKNMIPASQPMAS